MTIVEFLLARIAEDEERNIHALGCPYGASEGVDDCECGAGSQLRADAKAKRRIVELHEHSDDALPDRQTGERIGCMICHASRFGDYAGGWCTTLRTLALPHADHPDYDDTWRTL